MGKPLVVGLCSGIRAHEAGVASNRGTPRRGEYVTELCTHRPSRSERYLGLTSLPEEPHGINLNEVVTR